MTRSPIELFWTAKKNKKKKNKKKRTRRKGTRKKEQEEQEEQDEQEETSQELRMLSSVTLDCQVTNIVMNSGSQL